MKINLLTRIPLPQCKSTSLVGPLRGTKKAGTGMIMDTREGVKERERGLKKP